MAQNGVSGLTDKLFRKSLSVLEWLLLAQSEHTPIRRGLKSANRRHGGLFEKEEAANRGLLLCDRQSLGTVTWHKKSPGRPPLRAHQRL
jgi:hypothetical protein